MHMIFYYRLPEVDLETVESLYQRYFRYLGKHGRVTNIYLSDWVIYFDVTILKCDLYHIITKSINKGLQFKGFNYEYHS